MRGIRNGMERAGEGGNGEMVVGDELSNQHHLTTRGLEIWQAIQI